MVHMLCFLELHKAKWPKFPNKAIMQFMEGNPFFFVSLWLWFMV